MCKFKIVCKAVEKVMVPLPDCVPGEWGPTKAEKLFGLRGTSHPMPIIYAAPPSNIDLREDGRPLTLNIEFEKTRPVLDFVTKLYKNGVKEEELRQGARYRIKDQYVIFDIKVESYPLSRNLSWTTTFYCRFHRTGSMGSTSTRGKTGRTRCSTAANT